MKYQTIVADPPWEYPEGFAAGTGHPWRRGHKGGVDIRRLPYPSMTLEDIAALPMRELADDDCRLFMWTTNRYLPDSFGIMRGWGFRYRQTLVWHKRTTNLPAHIAPNSAEFILVGTIGKPARLGHLPSAVIGTSRGGIEPRHSRKPEVWLDYFEQVSPGPYLELFARRQRLGWDSWGNECRNDVELDIIAELAAEMGELQTIVDNEQTAHIDCAASGEAQRQRAEKAEAELAALKARRRDVEMSHALDG